MALPLAYLVAVASGYLIGSISFAVIIAKANGVNIFAVGSGNPGATNVLRSLGKGRGYLCFALDALKGVASVGVGLLLHGMVVPATGPGELSLHADLVPIAGLFSAILGHSFSLFLRFRGGKGVATTIGGLAALLPWVILIALVVWLLVYFSTRYVSLASILLGASLPVSAWLTGARLSHLILCGILALLIIVRHKKNIQRLLKGEELKATPRKA